LVETTPILALPDKPSIAVLPFQNMSGDPEQEYFADGMVEEVITALSRIRWLFVIARNSTFTYKGQTVDVKQVGRELGVRYVLEGSVRKAGNRVRITGQLIEVTTGTHLWADRFDGSLEDVFDLQDKVAVSVAGVIEPALQAAEIRRTADRPTNDLTAYDLYLRALATINSQTRERNLKALGLLNQAIAIDPHYGPALAWAAHCHMRLNINGWTDEPKSLAARPSILPDRHSRWGEATRGKRPGHPYQRRLRVGAFRRGYRVHDGADRWCVGAQPELRPRLGSQRYSKDVGGRTRYRNRACQNLAAPESARAARHAPRRNR
jgi:adenylate cyclase